MSSHVLHFHKVRIRDSDKLEQTRQAFLLLEYLAASILLPSSPATKLGSHHPRPKRCNYILVSCHWLQDSLPDLVEEILKLASFHH